MYDMLGNYLGGYNPTGVDPEEERRRREEELRKQQQAQSQPVKQTITIDPTTGQQKMKIEGSVQDLSVANPLTPTVTAPVNPVDVYNRYTSQMESGNNPNIGYHNLQKSTAYGQYGITAPQYQEIQRANPQFANRPITSLTPEEQTQANTTSRDVYARQLQAKGIEPTEANLRLAHLLGAGGARQYLNTGAISPEAATANNGEQRVRQMAEQRLQGPISPTQQMPMIAGTPSSDIGLTPTEQAISQMSQTPGFNPNAPVNPLNLPQNQNPLFTPAAGVAEQAGPPTNLMTAQGWAERLNTAKQSDGMLASLAYDPNAPQFLREEASADLLNRLESTKKNNIALQEWKNAVESGNLVPVMNKIQKKTDEGNWLKYLLYGFISPELAKSERQKLFPEEGATWQPFVSEDGQRSGLILIRPNGEPIKGKFDDLTPLSEKDLIKYATGAGGLGKPDYVGGSVVNDATQQIGRIVSKNGRTMIESGGRLYQPTTAWRSNTVGTDVANAARMALVEIQKRGGGKAAEVIAETNAKYGTNFSADSAGLSALQRIAQGQSPVGATTAPGGAVTAPGGAVTAPGGQGVQTMPSAGGATPASVASAQEVATSTGKELGKSNIEYANQLAKDRQTATAQRSTIDRLQKSIDANPEFWGVVSNSPAFMAFRDAQSDEKKAAALNQLAQNLSIPDSKRAAFNAAMNDYRVLEVNAVTSSGLSASQTNTEKESQRVVSQIGNITDKPAAAKAALEYAKGKIEYADAKARAWVEARRNNPNIDRLEFEDRFDATQGEKIFKDVNERMAKILGGNVGGAIQEGQKSTSKSGKPIIYRNGRWEYQ